MSHALQLLTARPLRLSDLLTPLFEDYPDLDATEYSHEHARGYVFAGEESTRGIHVSFSRFDDDERAMFEEQEDPGAPDGVRTVPLPENLHYVELRYNALASPEDVGFAVELARVGVERFGASLFHEYNRVSLGYLSPEWVRDVASAPAHMFMSMAQKRDSQIQAKGRRRDLFIGPWLAGRYALWLEEFGSRPEIPDDQRAGLWLISRFKQLQQLDFAPPHRAQLRVRALYEAAREARRPRLPHRRAPPRHRQSPPRGHGRRCRLARDLLRRADPRRPNVLRRGRARVALDRDWYRRMDERQYASRPLTLREIMEFYDVIRERGWENTVMVDEILRDAWEGKGIV